MKLKINLIIFLVVVLICLHPGANNCDAQSSSQFDYQELSWSPNGNWISFTATQNKNSDIYLIKSDGSELKRLTSDPAADAYVSWSPNGEKIVFGSNKSGKFGIYSMNLDGSDLLRLTDDFADCAFPVWAPNGKKLAFMAKREKETWQIYVMDPDGKNQKRLTNNKANDYNPAWSPDGSTLAFESDRDGNDSDEIYTILANGTKEMRITNNNSAQINDVFPTWISKNQISLSAVKDRKVDIFVISKDGSDRKLIIERAFYGRWSPDKSRIAYISQGSQDLPPQIYVMKADGSSRTQLTR
jgi:Tol biopolymer transport system component